MTKTKALALQKFNPTTGKKFLSIVARKAKKIRITSAGEYQAAWTTVLSIDAFLASPFIRGETEQKARLWAAYKHTADQLDYFVKTAKAHKAAIIAARLTYAAQAEARAEVMRARMEKLARKRAIAEARILARALRKEGAHKQAAAVIHAAKHAPMPAPPALVQKSAGSVQSVKYVFEVKQPALVPLRYWKIDEKLIRKDVNAFGCDANIPGVVVSIQMKEHSRKGKR